MEARQQKLYYFFLFGIALVSVVLLSTVMKPGNKREAGGEKARVQGKSADEVAAGKTGAAPEQPKPAAPERAKKEAGNPAERARKARERLGKQTTAVIETGRYRATVSDLNAGLVSFQIKGDRYRDRKNKPIDIVTTDKERYFPLAVELQDAQTGETVLGDDVFWKVKRISRRALRLSLDAGGIEISRKLDAGKGPYQLWVTTTVSNRTGEPRRLAHGIAVHRYVERALEKTPIPLLAVPSAEVSKGLCYVLAREKGAGAEQPSEPSMERLAREKLLAPLTFKGTVKFAGVENVYFLNAIAPHPSADQPDLLSCRLHASNRGRNAEGEPLGSLFTTRLVFPEFELGPGAARSFRVLAYLGPKMPRDLAAAGHGLSKAIDFGFFAVLSQGLSWLLRAIHAGVGNWGVAIILLTFLVKAVLYPLTAKSLHSMARMKMLKPEMDRINELYKDDREKKSAAIMELYRKHKINPLGGCLPQLLQLPIWIALYTSLRTNVELYHAPFALWWTDLSSPDPYFVLPLALGALMFVQQKMSPPAADPVQAKMFLYMMPVMMGAFMLFLPAGLCLYILTNSVLSIGQQRLIERGLKKIQSPPAAGQGGGTAAPEDDSEVSFAGKEPRSKKSKPGKPQGRSRSVRKKKTA